MLWLVLISILVENEGHERVKKVRIARNLYPGYNLYTNYFPYLYNEVKNAQIVEDEQEYPWMARVVHSRISDEPYLCSAVLIEEGIFLTAARCLNALKVDYTTVIYDKQHWRVKAFITPIEANKQGIDDNGFVVVHDRGPNNWDIAKLISKKRTDDHFEWLDELMVNIESKVRVIGFGHEFINHTRQPERLWYLDAITNTDVCSKILTDNVDENTTLGYQVPCYYGCNYTVVVKDSGTYGPVTPNCLKYLGVVGAAVMSTKTEEVLGVATWGALSANPDEYYLPVGYTIANTVEFSRDFFCAKLIRNDNRYPVPPGRYQKLCSNPLPIKSEKKNDVND